MTPIVTILQNFVKLTCLEAAFPKIGFFGILVCNLETGQAMSRIFLNSCLLMDPNIWSTSFVVPEISGGGVEPPQMPLSCQKRQMPLTVKSLRFDPGV